MIQTVFCNKQLKNKLKKCNDLVNRTVKSGKITAHMTKVYISLGQIVPRTTVAKTTGPPSTSVVHLAKARHPQMWLIATVFLNICWSNLDHFPKLSG